MQPLPATSSRSCQAPTRNPSSSTATSPSPATPEDPDAVVVRIPQDGPTVFFNGVDIGYGFLFDDVTAEISHLTVSGPGAGASALVATVAT